MSLQEEVSKKYGNGTENDLQTKLTVCNIASKVSANYNVPCWIVLFIKFFLDVSCNILRIKAKVLEKKSIERKRKQSSFVSTNSNLSLLLIFISFQFLFFIQIKTRKRSPRKNSLFQCCTLKVPGRRNRLHPAACPLTCPHF